MNKYLKKLKTKKLFLHSRKAVAKDLKSVYSSLNEVDAQRALTEFNDIWGKKIS